MSRLTASGRFQPDNALFGSLTFSRCGESKGLGSNWFCYLTPHSLSKREAWSAKRIRRLPDPIPGGLCRDAQPLGQADDGQHGGGDFGNKQGVLRGEAVHSA